MWRAIEAQLSQSLGFSFKILERQQLKRKDIHGSPAQNYYLIGDQDKRYFIKLSARENLEHFQIEADNIELLAKSETLQVSMPICYGHCKDHAFIAYHYYPTKSLAAPNDAQVFGRQLAKLHAWGEQIEFGFDHDNYLEHILQPNQWHKKWASFFAEHRIGWQLQLLKEKNITFGDIDEIISQIRTQLASHQPKPSLLHGNLTPEHLALSVEGPIIFQPASYWGDREYDIAILLQNNEIHPSWLEAYQTQYALPQGYHSRSGLYQTYHLLNQYNQELAMQQEDSTRHQECQQAIDKLFV